MAADVPKSRKRKGATYHHISPVRMTAYSAGIRSTHARRSLDETAVSDALNRLASRGELASLQAIASARCDSEIMKCMDMLAAFNPDDSRWDDWRNYRRTELSYAN